MAWNWNDVWPHPEEEYFSESIPCSAGKPGLTVTVARCSRLKVSAGNDKLSQMGLNRMGNYASDQKNAKFYGLKLSLNTDKELIDQLDSQESIQGYIKRLIREDMAKKTKPAISSQQAEANFNATLELMKAVTKK